MNQYVCSLDQIKRKKKLRVKVGIHHILVTYEKGQVYAMKDKCPHKGFPLSLGRFEDGKIWCKEHGLSIFVKNGIVADDEKADALQMESYNRSVKTYKTTIIEGKVYIDK